MPPSSFLSLRPHHVAALSLTLLLGACTGSDDTHQVYPPSTSAGTGGKGGSGTGGSVTGGTSGTGSSTGGTAGESGAADGGAGDGEAGSGPVAALPWLHVEGNAIKDPNGNTVILRGVDMIDLGATETYEGGVRAMIDRLTDPDDTQGASPGWATRVLRLAVVPGESGVGSPEPYFPGQNYYERYLRPTVDYAKKKGVYAIIDWHYIDTTSLHVNATLDFWNDIAPRFANDSNVLFELYNEPINHGDWATTKADMQRFLDAVRQGAPDNLVLVGTPNWCQQVALAAQSPLTGTNLVYVAHMYPEHFKQTALRDQITTAARLVPVFLSEWGFQESSMDALLRGTISSYGAPLKDFVESERISWSAWCASAKWGPPMFDDNYTLRVGEGEMGGFVKDWLYDKRSADQAAP